MIRRVGRQGVGRKALSLVELDGRGRMEELRAGEATVVMVDKGTLSSAQTGTSSWATGRLWVFSKASRLQSREVFPS